MQAQRYKYDARRHNDVCIAECEFPGAEPVNSTGSGHNLPGAARFDPQIHAETRAAQGPVTVPRTSGERRYTIFRGTNPSPVAVWTAAELRAYRETAEARQAFARVGAAPDKATQDAIKSGLLRYTPAGEFPYRNNESLTVYTGEVILDVDAPTDWLGPRIAGIVEALRACPPVTDVSYSASGRLHVRVRTAAPHSGRHAAAFRAARAAVVAICPELDAWIDKSGATLSQPFICDAPNIWFNDDAPATPVPDEPERPRRHPDDRPATAPDFAQTLVERFAALADANPDALVNEWAVDDRRTWVGCAFAFADAVRLGANERDAFHAFDAVSRSAGGKYGQTDPQWRDAMRGARKAGGATFGTLVYHARRLGILPAPAARRPETRESVARAIWGDVRPQTLEIGRYLSETTETTAALFAWLDALPAGRMGAIEAPTGSGKTVAALQYGLQRGRPGRPFLYTTPLQMQWEALRERYRSQPGVAFVNKADNTSDKLQAAGVETASLVIATYDGCQRYAACGGPTPCGVALDEVHDFLAAWTFRRDAVRGVMRVMKRALDDGARVFLLSGTLPQGLSQTFRLADGLRIRPAHTTALRLETRTYRPPVDEHGRPAGAPDVNLHALVRETLAFAAEGNLLQGVLLNAKLSLRAMQRMYREQHGLYVPVIASDATGKDLAVMRYLQEHERLPEGINLFLATIKIACGFNIIDDRRALIHAVDNQTVNSFGRLTPENIVQFAARPRGKDDIRVIFHTIPDGEDDDGRPGRGPELEICRALELGRAARLADAANARLDGARAGELLSLPADAPVIADGGRFLVDEVGVAARAGAAFNRRRPLADTIEALRYYADVVDYRAVDVEAQPDPVRDDLQQDKTRQLAAVAVVVLWAAARGQAGARAAAGFAANRAGLKGTHIFRQIFGRHKEDLPDQDDLDLLDKLNVPDDKGASLGTAGVLIKEFGADEILRFVNRAAALETLGQTWDKALATVVDAARTSRLSRLRCWGACALAIAGVTAGRYVDGRAAAQLAEMERLVDAIAQECGVHAVTNEAAARAINKAGGFFGRLQTPREARELLTNFGRVVQRQRTRAQAADDKAAYDAAREQWKADAERQARALFPTLGPPPEDLTESDARDGLLTALARGLKHVKSAPLRQWLKAHARVIRPVRRHIRDARPVDRRRAFDLRPVVTLETFCDLLGGLDPQALRKAAEDARNGVARALDVAEQFLARTRGIIRDPAAAEYARKAAARDAVTTATNTTTEVVLEGAGTTGRMVAAPQPHPPPG